MVGGHQKDKACLDQARDFHPCPFSPAWGEELRTQSMVDHGWVPNFPPNPSAMSLENFLGGEHIRVLEG